MSYKENAFLGAFFCKNIWWIQKKAVPLHPLSLKNGARPKRAQAMIFEKMSIHNKIVVQEICIDHSWSIRVPEKFYT